MCAQHHPATEYRAYNVLLNKFFIVFRHSAKAIGDQSPILSVVCRGLPHAHHKTLSNSTRAPRGLSKPEECADLTLMMIKFIELRRFYHVMTCASFVCIFISKVSPDYFFNAAIRHKIHKAQLTNRSMRKLYQMRN